MELLTDENVDLLLLVNEREIPPEDKQKLIEGFRDEIGMSLDEKFGTLAFSGSLDLLDKFSDQLIIFMNDFQIEGKIFPVIRKNAIDQQFRDNLLRYSVFRRYWKVDEERSVILTYDINHKSGRSTKKYYSLQHAGALQVFPSCYWIPEEKIGYIANKFEQIVQESVADPSRDKSGNPIPYHYRVFRCYAIGSPDGLKRWKDMQLVLFMEKINSLRSRTRAKYSYLNYVVVAWNALEEEEQEKTLKKVKRFRYWKNESQKELRPYMNAHYQRMREMGISNHIVEEEIKVDQYDHQGNKTKELITFSLTLEDNLQELNNELQVLHDDTYEFVLSLTESKEYPEEVEEVRKITSEDFRV